MIIYNKKVNKKKRQKRQKRVSLSIAISIFANIFTKPIYSGLCRMKNGNTIALLEIHSKHRQDFILCIQKMKKMFYSKILKRA